jgi:hypothetical protein
MSQSEVHFGFEGHGVVARAVRCFSRRRRAWRFARELGLYLTVSLGVLLAWSLADWQLGLPPVAVLGGLFLAVLGAAGGLVIWAAAALTRREGPHWEAVYIEGLHGGLDNALIGTLQLVEEARRDAGMYSASLIDALATRAAEVLKGEHLPRLIDHGQAARVVAASGVLAAASLALVLFADGFIAGRVASVRGSYQAVVERIWPVRLMVTPGDKTVLRGEDDVTLGVEMVGGSYRSVRLIAEDDEGVQLVDELLPVADTTDGRKAKKLLEAGTLADVRKHVSYHFEAGRHLSATHTIRLVDRPRIENLSVDLSFPSYTHMMTQQLAGIFTSIRALRETLVTFSLAANKPLLRATLTFGNDAATAQPLDVSGRFAATQFTVRAEVGAELELLCEDGYSMKEPYRFKIEPLDDSPPEIEILMKKEELLLLKDGAKSFSFAYVAADDFGIAQVQVFYEIEAVDPMLARDKRTGELQPMTFARTERKATGLMKKAFAEIDLQPGDRMTFYMVATDNNTKSGPSRGRSRSHTFVVVLPSLAGYNQPEFDWAQRRSALLGALTKVRRNTDFLRLPQKQVTAEKTIPPPKHKLAAHVRPEGWPAGVEQAVTDYLQLLSSQFSGE